jgi:hypothetical protein
MATEKPGGLNQARAIKDNKQLPAIDPGTDRNHLRQ